MKKSIYLVLALALTFGLASIGFTQVQASALADPYALPTVPGAALTSTVVAVPDLPGTVVLDSGKYSPLGFKAGDVQFGGSGLKVSGLSGRSTASVYFAFPDYRYHWVGTISQWNGSKWVPLATTFLKDADGNVNWASASGAGNGIYALIIWYTGPAESYSSPDEPTVEPTYNPE